MSKCKKNMGNYYSLKLHSMTDKFIYLNQLLIKNENFKQYIIEKSPMCVFVLKKKPIKSTTTFNTMYRTIKS